MNTKIISITTLVVLLIAGGLYFGMKKPTQNNAYAFTQDQIDELELVQASEVVELKDGDTYVIDATIVKQHVGSQTIKRLAYNGQIPGPILKAPRGSKVTIIHNNLTDEATALHSHGLRGESRFDGAAPLTQKPIPVDGSFTYELEFPDVGVYWYHPHVREDYAQEMGLYGNFIVEDEGYWGSEAQDEYLILDDFDTDGVFTRDEETHTLMGRFGDKLLINDRENYQINLEAGQIARLFITNVANTRTFDVSFEGSDMKVVGGDNGRIQQEVMAENIILGTSERSIIEVLYKRPGTYPITHRGEKMGEVVVSSTTKTSQSKAFRGLRNNDGDYQYVLDNLDMFLEQEPDKNLRIDIEMRGQMADMMAMGVEEIEKDGETLYKMMGLELNLDQALEHCGLMEMVGCEELIEENEIGEPEEDDGIEWEDDMAMMNAMSNTENISWKLLDESTGVMPMIKDWTFDQGDFVKVRIFNDPTSMHPMQHPVHFHGQRFVVLTRDDEVNDNFQWKDSVLVPTGQTVDILIEMTNDGDWMAHCHIAEHNAAGMMFNFKVVENNTNISTDPVSSMVTEYEIQGTQHVAPGEAHDAYNSNPPSSGWHYAQAPSWGAYKKPIPDESALHAVEHGGIWISYTEEISEDDLDEIKKIQRQNAGAVISTPRPENDSPIAVVAWGKVMKLATVDVDLITEFIDENKNNTHEPLAR